MHIAFVNQWYPPNSHGGVAMHNANIAMALTEFGHQVTVITQRRPGDSTYQVQNGVNVYRVASPNLHRYKRIPIAGRQYRLVQALLYSYLVCRKLTEIHSHQPVNAVEFADINAEGFFWDSRTAGAMFVRCHTPSFVLSRHYTKSELPYDPRVLGCLEKQVIRRARTLTTPSQDMAEVIAETCQLPADRFYHIPNALDTNFWSPPEHKPASETITVLHVGRMERAKGIDVLLQAIPDVCKHCDGVRFVFIGGDRPREDGSSTRAFVEQQLQQYITRGQVEIRGSVSDEDLLKAYQAAEIVVVPSVLYESFSYTVAQAMSCGLPVVASRIGGIPETLDQGNSGILIEPGNVNALADAIVMLSRDPAKRREIGKASREYALIHFESRLVARQLVDVYMPAKKT